MRNFQYAAGATPLDPDECAGLVPRHITTQAELNEWEQANIVEALRWISRQGRRDLLDELFLRQLHQRMFGKTWKWAGTYRQTDKNIGVDHRHIQVQLRNLLEDVKAQVEFKSYAPDELALRFHHRLVWIHPFANGNGRHARQAADMLITRLGARAFTWGGGSLVAPGDERQAYLAALRAADARDMAPLLRFARAR